MSKIFVILFIQSIFVILFAKCPDGTTPALSDNSTCLIFVSTKKPFLIAESICQQHKGHLASIHSAFDSAFIQEEAQQNFTANTTDNFWIGLNDFQTFQTWEWIDGSVLNFVDWDKGQPQNIPGYDCGAAKVSSGRWISDDCDSDKPFVCEIKAVTATTTTTFQSATPTQNPQKCSGNWKYFETTGFCYKSFTKDSNWGDAENFCFTQGGHLTSIHSLAENIFVANLIPFAPNDHTCDKDTWAWIGFFTVTKDANWMWTDNTAFNFSAWAPGRPCCPKNSYCGILWNGPPCGGAPLETWADGTCSAIASYFVCKKLPN
uniref:C-type lectin domain-containing protein n=1 Tax=Panagrolaimus sp. ES5 TaxID=591445 RepID=A0AC34FEB7_9BILA